MLGAFLFSLFFGFLSASIVHPVFHKVLRFHAQWRSTFVACMMTSLVCGLTFATAMISYDRKSGFHALLVIATTLAASFIAGLLSFRLIIRSESGRSLNLFTSALMSGFLITPPALLVIVLQLFEDHP